MAASLSRQIAVEILFQSEKRASYINLALNRRLGQSTLSQRERAFVSNLVYTTVRQLGSIDRLLGAHLKGDLSSLPAPIRAVLRLALAEILYTKTSPQVAVHQGVELAKKYGHRGTVGLVNGVLRNILRSGAQIPLPSLEEDPVEHIAGAYSHPTWLVQRWVNGFGVDSTRQLCAANNETPPLTIRVNPLRTDRQSLKKDLQNEGLTVEECRYSPYGLHLRGGVTLDRSPSFVEGHFTVQDEASMLVGPALAPEPGQLVVDLCSAPGGKTTHLAALMENQGQIFAFDLHPHKIKLVEETTKRLGITNVQTACLDARHLLTKRRELVGQAHRVLLDAPCSGLGVLRRRPDARWRKKPEEIPSLVQLQRELLTTAVGLLRPGGRLLYSTCSFEEEETVDNVQWLLANQPVEPADIRLFLPKDLTSETTANHCLTLFPHIHGTDGFFMALFSRK
ncbi:MAG: 16S rRNA (cytosine(967)-C(5))-methyltransferase RsmB [Limnochordia bacterium]|jgi:16S rRNA (cytosine967-C5)-methyltransferase